MAKASEKYEVMYIINPNLSEEETAAVVEKFISEGYYVLMKFTSAPEFPSELDRILCITDGILRRLITLRAE